MSYFCHMKKMLLTCLSLIFCVNSFSQSFRVGIAGGLSSTDVSGMDPYDGDEDFYRVGVVAGGFVNRTFSERLSIQMEILYATKGSLQPADSSDNYLYDKLRLDYIEIPLLFKYKMHLIVNKEALDKLEFEAGPSFGVLLNASHENNYGEISNDRPFNKMDYLINIGLNYYFSDNFSFDLRFANSIVPFDLRFANSIVPIRPHDNNVTYGLNKGEYNTTFNFMLRYLFDSAESQRNHRNTDGESE
jgi:hypothetical protein